MGRGSSSDPKLFMSSEGLAWEHPGWAQLLSSLRLAHPRLAILIRTYRGYVKELNGAGLQARGRARELWYCGPKCL